MATIWEHHFYRLNTGLPPMPAVHCRRDNAGSVAGGSVVSGIVRIVESGSVARGSVESGIKASSSDEK